MVELHAHSLLSDGDLLLSELVRRYEDAGYAGVAVTDHVDMSNCDFVIERLSKGAEALTDATGVTVVAGAEVTHVPPLLIEWVVHRCRAAGAAVVLVHGETIVEPVAPGTNRAAIEAGADVLAHPGLITEEDVKLAVSSGVRLEVSSRSGHSLTNGHVVALAARCGAALSYGTDMHGPGDILRIDQVRRVLAGAGLTAEQVEQVLAADRELLEAAGKAT